MSHRTLLFLSLTAFIAVQTHASTIIGNPNPSVTLDQGNAVWLEAVVATPCGSTTSHTSTVQQQLDTGDSVSVSLPEDTFCQLTVVVGWSSSQTLTNVTVDGFDTLITQPGGQALDIEIDATTASATLTW